MAIKMRVLYASNKGKIATMANMIKAEYDLSVNAVDKIPPAYSCNNERIVILMLSLKGDPADQLRLFCQELTKARAQNVALVIDGNEAAAENMKAILVKAGTNVIDEVHFVKTGFLPFLSSVKDEEKKTVTDWMDKISANLA